MADQNGDHVDGRTRRKRKKQLETWNVDRIEKMGHKVITQGEQIVAFAKSLREKGFRKFPWIPQGMQTLADTTLPKLIRKNLRERLQRELKNLR